ncbi:hypothetical protein MMC24_004051 [Lignoscripta atroalba]|nr:hypothetical protein [Lignoscripta atroalba]
MTGSDQADLPADFSSTGLDLQGGAFSPSLFPENSMDFNEFLTETLRAPPTSLEAHNGGYEGPETYGTGTVQTDDLFTGPSPMSPSSISELMRQWNELVGNASKTPLLPQSGSDQGFPVSPALFEPFPNQDLPRCDGLAEQLPLSPALQWSPLSDLPPSDGGDFTNFKQTDPIEPSPFSPPLPPTAPVTVSPPRSLAASMNLHNLSQLYGQNDQVQLKTSFLLYGSKPPTGPAPSPTEETVTPGVESFALSSDEGDKGDLPPRKIRKIRKGGRDAQTQTEPVSTESAGTERAGIEPTGTEPAGTERLGFGAVRPTSESAVPTLRIQRGPDPPASNVGEQPGRGLNGRKQPRAPLGIVREQAGREEAKPWVKTNPSKGMNRRTTKIADYKPEEHYQPLPNTPDSWSCFEYTSHGELKPNRYYTAQEIEHYLSSHPLHNTNAGYDPKSSGLVLWIQRNPADSARRYPTKDSSRCRFINCFGSRNTIGQAQYRIAFDEQYHKDANHDPQHNAGYVHLYCIEKLLDFPQICARMNVQAEDRTLPNEPNGRNRMLFSTGQELDIAKDFITTCQQRGTPEGYPHHHMANRPHEGTLVHKLAAAKLQHQPQAIQKQRVARGEKDSMVSKHLGNLEIEATERDKTRKYDNQNWKGPKPGSKRKRGRGRAGSKRRRGRQESDDEEDDEDDEDEYLE